MTRVFGRTVQGWSAEYVCAALKGWMVVQHHSDGRCAPDLAFHIPEDSDPTSCYSGYTRPGSKLVELATIDWRHGVLPHEIVHVVDVTYGGHMGHCFWNERGVNDALEMLGVSAYDALPIENCELTYSR